MESIIETFHIDWKIIIAQAVNFGVVFVVLYIFALKPLGKLMKEREEKIAKGVSDAKNNALMLAETSRESEAALTDARREATDFFAQSKREAEMKKAEMLEVAREEVEKIIMSGKASLESEKKRMVEVAKNEIATLALLATEKLLKDRKDLNNL